VHSSSYILCINLQTCSIEEYNMFSLLCHHYPIGSSSIISNITTSWLPPYQLMFYFNMFMYGIDTCCHTVMAEFHIHLRCRTGLFTQVFLSCGKDSADLLLESWFKYDPPWTNASISWSIQG
jgi:hypothetical protein